MAGVAVRGAIEAQWAEGGISERVSSPEELASVTARVLVEAVGTDAARQLLRDELALYLLDYKGAVLDGRDARRTE